MITSLCSYQMGPGSNVTGRTQSRARTKPRTMGMAWLWSVAWHRVGSSIESSRHRLIWYSFVTEKGPGLSPMDYLR